MLNAMPERKRRNIPGYLFAMLGSLAFSIPVAVPAQGIEEIVVTAQKREESLQDVPISVVAFTGDALNELGVQNSEDVMSLVPNAGLQGQGGSKQNYFIRGVGTSDFHINVVSAVGVYLDDVALNAPNAITFSAFDLERVEVMRGPQNTLFGRNTTGGAVNYISRKPGVEDGFNGHLRGGYGRHDQFDIEGAVGIPLGENAAARVAFVSNIRDGVYDNLTLGKKEGGHSRQAGRVQLLMQPSDTMELLFNFHGGMSRDNPLPFKSVGTQDPNNITAPCAVPLNDLIPQNNPNCVDSSNFNHQADDWDTAYGNMEFKEDIDLWGTSLKASLDIGGMTLTSVTAFDSFEVEYKEDSDGAPNMIFQFYQQGDYEQWSQELRLQSAADQSLRWILGFYYFMEDARYATAVRRTPAPFAPSAPGRFNIIPNTYVEQDNEVFSGYGQLEFDLQDSVTATVGFRWTDETKKGTNTPSVRCSGVGGPPFCPNLSEQAFLGFDLIPTLPGVFFPPEEILDSASEEWGARFALDWQVNDDLLVYGSVSRGFKGGGFSLAALAAFTGTAAESVDPEVLWAYEIGFKSSWMDGALNLNAAGFYYDWTDLQSFQPILFPEIGEVIPRLLNVPESSNIGAEIELQWVPAEGWYISGGLGLSNAEIDDPGGIIGVQKGNDLTNAPDLTFNGLVRKEIQVGAGTLALQANWNYKDDVTYDLANAPYLSQESWWNLNARGSYAFGPDEQFEIAVWGKNLTGEEYCTGLVSLQGLSESLLCYGNYSDPTYGVTAGIRFD